jgi:tripartite-type tricarboxylate transporter receptor subunit TctC
MRLLARLCLGMAMIFGGAATAEADTYPVRTVRIVVPFGAGGPADIYARIIGQHLSEALKQPFIIENRTGAGGVIGTTEVARSAADGYTLLMMSNTTTANETLLPNRGYDLLRDFAPVAPVNASDLVMVVHPSVAATNLAEFIALAKSKPGTLNYASSGQGTPYHLAGELFKALTGTEILHVPYRNSGDARNGVIGGHIHMMLDAVTTMAPTVAGGQVRALATTGPKRSTILPDVPTATEAGVAGYQATIWLGIMAPTGTPKAIVDLLNAEIRKFQASAPVQQSWAAQGAEPLLMSPDEFGQYLTGDIAKWRQIIQSANIAPR